MLFTILLVAAPPPSLTALNFFEVSTPGHVRPIEWPARLTFEPIFVESLDEFRRLLRGSRWRTSYSCDGRPARPSPQQYDGIYHAREDLVFGASTVEVIHEDRARRAVNRVEYTYLVRNLGAGRFEILWPGGEYATDEWTVRRVRETSELILESQTGVPSGCAGTGHVRSIWVPIDPAVF